MASAAVPGSRPLLAFTPRASRSHGSTKGITSSDTVRHQQGVKLDSSMTVAAPLQDLEVGAVREAPTYDLKDSEIVKKSTNLPNLQIANSLTNPLRQVIIMGGPASGKGTISEHIASKYNLIHISTGDMLRDMVASSKPGDGNEMAAMAKKYMEQGKLVPDELMTALVLQRIRMDDVQQRGYILDGFPRTPEQASALFDAGVIPELVLSIKVPDQILTQRISGRRVDPVTRRTYHVDFNPPPNEEVKRRVIQRNDDTEEKIAQRLKQFHQNENLVKEWYTDLIIEIDGAGPPNDVVRLVDQLTSGVAC